MTNNEEIRILPHTVRAIWLSKKSRDVILEWYGERFYIGRAEFQDEADTWAFEENQDLEKIRDPEDRFSISDIMDDGLTEELDNAINENQGAWFEVEQILVDTSVTYKSIKVFCDLCIGKAYLEEFPSNWDDLDMDQQNAYMNQQIQEGNIGAWHEGFTGGPPEEWTITCQSCTPTMPETIEVTIGQGFEPDIWESFDWEGRAKSGELKHPTLAKITLDENGAGVEWTFTLPKEEARRLYNMLQVVAGLNMQMSYQDDLGFKPMEIINDE